MTGQLAVALARRIHWSPGLGNGRDEARSGSTVQCTDRKGAAGPAGYVCQEREGLILKAI